MSKRRTTEEFIEECTKIHQGKYDYSLVNYKSKEHKVQIICPIHGVFEQIAKLHLKGSGCPKCSYIYRSNLYKKNIEDFILEANKIHNNFYTYEKFEYIDSHTKSVITCPIHGDFIQKPNDHLQGKGCPKCNMSHLEREVFSFLHKNKINFEYQKKFEWLGKQSLDFYLIDYNIGIECQGKQHFGYGGWSDEYDFSLQKKRDFIKRELCDKNNVHLIYYSNLQIYYDDFYNENNVFDNMDKFAIKILNKKQNSWIDDISSYVNNLLFYDDQRKLFDFFYIDLQNNSEKYVPNYFELKRLKDSRKNGKMSIHIFEDEWLNKCDIVKSRIKNILCKNEQKIYARKCNIKIVSNKESKKFLDKNHIQGNIYGKYNIGLYYNQELVSLMTFGNLRKNLGSNASKNSYELLRFCNKLNTTVVGSGSKLLNFFIKEYMPSKIISYCDLRWSDGKIYDILGFKLSHISRPNYFYVNEKDKKRENRFKYRKDVLVKHGYDKNKSEHEIMLNKHIYRIYDCGNKVYILELN